MSQRVVEVDTYNVLRSLENLNSQGYHIDCIYDAYERHKTFILATLKEPEKRLETKIEKAAKSSSEELYEHLEMYAAAFLKKTQLDPENCVLEYRPNGEGGAIYEYKRK